MNSMGVAIPFNKMLGKHQNVLKTMKGTKIEHNCCNTTTIYLVRKTLYSPTMVINIATVYDVSPIHTMHRKNVNIFNLGCLRQSGIVNHKTKVMGHLKINVMKLVSGEIFHGLSA